MKVRQELDGLQQHEGCPINWRDPVEGINKSPDGFGAPWSGGANFMLMDGSVRFLSNGIDPKVLRAPSTPVGGEKVDVDRALKGTLELGMF